MFSLHKLLLISAVILGISALHIVYMPEKEAAIGSSETQIAQKDRQLLNDKDEKTSERQVFNANAEKDLVYDVNELVDPDIPSYSDIYFDNIPKANNGEIISQYRVSYALSYCSPLSDFKSISDIERDSKNGYFGSLSAAESDKLISAIKSAFTLCKDIFPYIGDQDIRSLGETWLEKAAAGGHPIAKLQLLLEPEWELTQNPNGPGQFWQPKPLKITKEDSSKLLYAAFNFSQHAGVIEQENAFKLAARHYTTFIEAENDIKLETAESYIFPGPEGDAWHLLACKWALRCPEDEMINSWEEYLFPFQIDEIMAKADNYSQAILSENWQALDLD